MINLDSLKAVMRTEKSKKMTPYWLPNDGGLMVIYFDTKVKENHKKKHIQVKLNSDVSKTYSFLMMLLRCA